MKNDKISVVVPIYNSEKYIRRCLNSIINQTYSNLEIILINDGSTDESLKIITEYEKIDTRIKVINKKNSGVSDSRNIGIKEARGEFICFVDSDDWLENNMLEKMSEKQKITEADVVRCNYYRKYENASLNIKSNLYGLENKILKNEELDIFLDRILSGEIPGYMWLLLIKTQIVKKMAVLDTRLSMMEDTIFNINLILNINSIYIYDQPLYNYFMNIDSASKSDKYYIRNFENVMLVNDMIEKILEDSSKNNCIRSKLYNTAHAKFIDGTCYNLYKNTNINKKLIEEFSKIIKNMKVHQIINNSDLSMVNFHIRTALYLIKAEKVYLLILFYALRKFLALFKNIIMKRTED